jgi:hypothetical protein
VAVAGQCGDVAAHRVGQLHGRGADATGRATDQDPFTVGQPDAVA